MKNKSLHLVLILSATWLLINLIQAAVLGLDPDEAYYWIYAQALDWGYFDHPPVIALLVLIGKSIVGGSLGVRLLIPVLSLGTFLLLWDLAGRPKQWHDLGFLALLFGAMPLLEIYAFIATPDAPLLFFSALFFWTYQKFLTRPSVWIALWWGGVMAALLYSKYHGVLLIFFTLLSNWRLLLNPYFYLAGIFGALLFFPHLYWQYSHDFPSFRYHLSGRDDPYQLKHTLNYLLNQLLIFSPLLFPFIVRIIWQRPADKPLEKAFRYVIVGFWAFFFYTTFKGHVEPQWTVILSLPFILILYWEGQKNARLYRQLKLMAGISVGLLVLVRIVLAWPNTGLKTPFNRNSWVTELQTKTDGEPLVFQDSYRNPAMYHFYSGERAYTFTDNCYRHNQYDIFNWEEELHNQSVWILGQTTWESDSLEVFSLSGRTFNAKRIDSLQISQKVSLSTVLPPSPWKMGDVFTFDIELTNPYPHDIYPERGGLPLSIKERYVPFDCLQDNSQLQLIDPPKVWPANASIQLKATMKVVDDLPAGDYSFFLCIQSGDLPLAFASKGRKIELIE